MRQNLHISLWFLFLFLAFPALANDHQNFAVIVNAKNTQKIDKKLIKNIASDIIANWENGEPIKLYFPRVKSVTRRSFTLDVLGISAKQDAMNWENKKITNTLNNKMPKYLRDKIILKMVAKHPNALGYVSPDIIKDNPNIRVVYTN